MVTCPYCGKLNRITGSLASSAYCGVCKSTIWRKPALGIGWTLAFTISALVLYIPANLLPILSVTRLGEYSENTVISGVGELIARGMWGIATVVFLASIVIPLVKIFSLLYLCGSTYWPNNKKLGTTIYKIVHTIGPWSMLDVFVVAILVSLVQLRDLANISPEPGLVAFTAVVVLTTLASQSFDPRYLWKHE